MSDIHVRLREWDSIGPTSAAPNNGLRDFRFDDAAHRRLADELTKAGTLQFQELRDGLRIQARSHVGRIRLGRLTVTIAPKIGASELLFARPIIF